MLFLKTAPVARCYAKMMYMIAGKLTVRCFLLISCIISFVQLTAQSHKIEGNITDPDNKPLEFAEVNLLNKDSLSLQSDISRKDGGFTLSIKPGDYILQVKYLGQRFYSTALAVNRDANLGTIKIEPQKEQEGVTVFAKKRLIERKVDRLVFNVENSILSRGMDLTQVLKGTPMLSVNDFGISLVGKSSVAVMIDDKILNIGGADLINYLKSLRSDDIAKIEIITAPPAKYEAQGNSGIINIVLKKNTKLGWSGNFSTSYMQASYPGTSNNLGINYQSKKTIATLRLRQYTRATRATEQSHLIGVNSIISGDRRKDMDNGIGANLNLGYKLNKRSTIGLIYDIGRINSNMNIENQTTYKTLAVVDSILNTNSRHRNPVLTQTLNAYFDHKIDSTGKKLGIALNYFSNLPETEVDFSTYSNKTLLTDHVKNKSDINYSIWSGQADFYLPFGKTVFETGAKFTSFSNRSVVQYLIFENPAFKIDPAKSNEFNYAEQNFALYASASRDFGKKWSGKAGLRYEYSDIKSHSITTGGRTKYGYGNVFPTFYLQYKVNDNNTFSFNYSKRINRPNFRALNPFRWYSNPYTFNTGNPVLRPSYNHNLELTYLYKSIFSISFYGQKLVNGYGRIVTVQNGIKEVNYKNYLTQYDVGSNASLYVNPYTWWEMSSSVAAFYSSSKSSISEVLPQKGFSFYYDVNNTFTLSKAKQVFFFLNFWHSLPSKQGNAYSKNLSALSSGLRFSLFEKRLMINTSVEDIYKGLVSKGSVYFRDYTLNYNNYYDARRFTINLTYTFGNRNVNSNSKRVQFDDKYRAN